MKKWQRDTIALGAASFLSFTILEGAALIMGCAHLAAVCIWGLIVSCGGFAALWLEHQEADRLAELHKTEKVSQ